MSTTITISEEKWINRNNPLWDTIKNLFPEVAQAEDEYHCGITLKFQLIYTSGAEVHDWVKDNCSDVGEDSADYDISYDEIQSLAKKFEVFKGVASRISPNGNFIYNACW